jgi:lipid A 3-O-deacylase
VFVILTTTISTLRNAYAQDETLARSVVVGVGESKDGIEIQRLGLRKDFDLLSCDGFGCLAGYYEASLNYWRHGNEEISGIAFSPVFVYYFGYELNSVRPYLNAGIGVAMISDRKIGDRDLSSNFLFENRMGFGLRGKRFDIHFRYLHYSNADLKKPNEGIDIFMISFGVPF